jgi:hypothetical protein
MGVTLPRNNVCCDLIYLSCQFHLSLLPTGDLEVIDVELVLSLYQANREQ